MPHLSQVYMPTFLWVRPRSPSFGSTITVKSFEGVAIAVPQLGQEGKRYRSMESVMLNLCYSRIDSKSETADQRMTLANEDMFGSWATSSSMLIAFAALTAKLTF